MPGPGPDAGVPALSLNTRYSLGYKISPRASGTRIGPLRTSVSLRDAWIHLLSLINFSLELRTCQNKKSEGETAFLYAPHPVLNSNSTSILVSSSLRLPKAE